MTVRGMLSRQDRARARSAARRLSARAALVFLLCAALLLALERAHALAGLPRLPLPDAGGGFLGRLLGTLLLPVLGLLRGGIVLLAAAVVALLLDRALRPLLRRGPARTAAALGARLGTDRFAAALEERGALAPLVREGVRKRPPPAGVLAPPPPGRLFRWTLRGAGILVLLLSVTFGTAEGALPGNRTARATGGGAGRLQASLRLTLAGPKGPFGTSGPIPLVARAVAEGELSAALPVRFVLDGGPESDSGLRFRLDRGKSEDTIHLDLRAFLHAGLAPGEHVLVARAGGAQSNPYRFRIEAPPGPSKAPPTARKPQASPKGSERFHPRFVEPLVRDGKKVEKLAHVPVVAPGGAGGERRSLQEAWPDLRRRAEAALSRPGLSPESKALIRGYFDRLHEAGKGG